MHGLHVPSVLAVVAIIGAGATDAYAQLRARVYASGFTTPVAFVADPLDASIQFVVQQNGRVRGVRNGAVLPTDFLDLSSVVSTGGERGLLGLTFAPQAVAPGHPDQPLGHRFFVNFTDTAGNTVIARFNRSSDPLVADPTSRFDLKWNGPTGPAFIVQPFANHNGGHLAFGPDGYLYIGLGDGGSGGDPGDYAQSPSHLLGKMLRIDVNVPDTHPTGYAIPSSNPFPADRLPAVRSEIWAFGYRNPWRYSFDDPARGGTGALIVGDVGQGAREEIDYEPPNAGGRNYGWRNREGTRPFDNSHLPAFVPLRDPIHEYDRSAGQSITGGFVYRGTALGAVYQGRYFFADFVQGRVWSIAIVQDAAGEGHALDQLEHTMELGDGTSLGNISSFGVDAEGELYFVGYSRGVILKIVLTI